VLTVLRVMIQMVRGEVKLGERFARILEFGKLFSGTRLLAEFSEAQEGELKRMELSLHGKSTRYEL
jgi:hypothetical protein